ncbi:MAG: signal peptidase I [candidate division Zixibacteria bacterium CG_4_9_14_3_um_filter_46_8]|nr:MAG: signal peptidase I [candidate division Zixibacteria bacterium CG_4_9_14_3_um_filter_46_8]
MHLFGKRASAKKRPKRTFTGVVWEYTQSLAIALVLALIIKASIVEAYKIPSGSMEDTLLVGDFLLANKFIYGMRLPIPFVDIRLPALAEPKPGDVIIFKYPRDPSVNYIKRCVATGGQVVEIRDKVVYVDGTPFQNPAFSKFTDPHIYPAGAYGIRDNMPPTAVPPGMLFMMGDNRDNSADSRFWGFLDRKLVQGKAMVIHWSWAPDTNAPELSLKKPLSFPHLIFYDLIHFPNRVRWSRLASVIN